MLGGDHARRPTVSGVVHQNQGLKTLYAARDVMGEMIRISGAAMQPQLLRGPSESPLRDSPFPSNKEMPLIRRALLALLVVLPVLANARPADTTAVVHVPINVSIWRGISIGDAVAGGPEASRVRHSLSLALPYGEADRLTGASIGVFGTTYRSDVTGIQIGGIGNVAGSSLAGIQVSGLAAVVGDRLAGIQTAGLAAVAGSGGGGLQASGLANVAGGPFRGIQVAGLANVAERLAGIQVTGLASVSGGATAGIQMAGLASVAGDGLGGLQVAGIANISGGETRGLQTSGLVNITGDRARGLQVAGLANIVGEDLVGAQISGLVNVTGGTMGGLQAGPVNVAAHARGLQIGIVNIAGRQSGMPVGLLSLAEDVPVHLEVWTDETAGLHVGLRSGSATVSNYFALAARPASGAEYRWAVVAGLGVERPAGARSHWGLDLLSSAVISENLSAMTGGLLRLRGRGIFEVTPTVSLFAGPALNLWVSRRADGEGLAPYALASSGAPTFYRFWPGFEAGIRVPIARPFGRAPAGE
jgi:hypothetical protein